MTSKVFEFGLVTITDPKRYGKAFILKNGELHKETLGDHRRGTIRRIKTDIAGLREILKAAKPGQHLTCGVPDIPLDTDAPLAAKRLAGPGDIVRSDTHLQWPQGPGLMVIDVDGNGDHAVVSEHLVDTCEALLDCGVTYSLSTGSGITDAETGEVLQGSSGLHYRIGVKDASDIPRALHVWFDRLWLTGHGQVRISGAGTPLLRTHIDLAMTRPSQPMFMASHCGKGLVQVRQDYLNEGSLLDTRAALPDLTDAEQTRLKQIQQKALDAASEAIADAREAWTARQVEKLTAAGLDPDLARERCSSALARDLYAEWPLILADGRKLTVGDVLASPAEFHGVACRDPIEPDYGSASVAKLYPAQDKPVLRSHAHGGQIYFLHALTRQETDSGSAMVLRILESSRNSSTNVPTAISGKRIRRVNADFAVLHPAKWVLVGFIAAGEVCVFAGQPGVGKSTAFASIALLVAGFGAEIGSDIEVDRRRKVAIVCENASQYQRIIHASCIEFGLDPEAVSQRIFLHETIRLGIGEIENELGSVIAECMNDEPPLLILDTASATFELANESDNSIVGQAMGKLRPMAENSGAAIWIAAHAAKALGREDAEISPRGASSWMGDVHGTGAVFREKTRNDVTFIKSAKNRWERSFDEIEVRTIVKTHLVVDERGVHQDLPIRIGVPKRAKTNHHERQAQRRQQAQQVNELLARDWVIQTVQDSSEALTRRRLEQIAADETELSRSALRTAVRNLIEQGSMCEVPILPPPKAGSRVRLMLVVGEK